MKTLECSALLMAVSGGRSLDIGYDYFNMSVIQIYRRPIENWVNCFYQHNIQHRCVNVTTEQERTSIVDDMSACLSISAPMVKVIIETAIFSSDACDTDEILHSPSIDIDSIPVLAWS